MCTNNIASIPLVNWGTTKLKELPKTVQYDFC